MHGVMQGVMRGALLTGLYFAGAVITVLYLRNPADVTLFWPAAGIGFTFVLHYGLRYAPAILLAQLLLHLLVVPVPLRFLPFSVGANFVSTLIACAYVISRRPQLQFRIKDGLLLLRGGFVLCLLSAGIGTLGMLQAGMVAVDAMPRVFLQWALGDLLGITAITPNMLLLVGKDRAARLPHLKFDGSLRERGIWIVVLILVLAGGLALIREGSMYPLAVSVLPLALLL